MHIQHLFRFSRIVISDVATRYALSFKRILSKSYFIFTNSEPLRTCPFIVSSRYPLYLELEDEGNTDSLIFYYQGAEPVSYSLYNEYGELLLQGSCLFDSDGKCQVSLEELAQGTYTITIMAGGTMYEGTFLLE